MGEVLPHTIINPFNDLYQGSTTWNEGRRKFYGLNGTNIYSERNKYIYSLGSAPEWLNKPTLWQYDESGRDTNQLARNADFYNIKGQIQLRGWVQRPLVNVESLGNELWDTSTSEFGGSGGNTRNLISRSGPTLAFPFVHPEMGKFYDSLNGLHPWNTFLKDNDPLSAKFAMDSLDPNSRLGLIHRLVKNQRQINPNQLSDLDLEYYKSISGVMKHSLKNHYNQKGRDKNKKDKNGGGSNNTLFERVDINQSGIMGKQSLQTKSSVPLGQNHRQAANADVFVDTAQPGASRIGLVNRKATDSNFGGSLETSEENGTRSFQRAIRKNNASKQEIPMDLQHLFEGSLNDEYKTEVENYWGPEPIEHYREMYNESLAKDTFEGNTLLVNNDVKELNEDNQPNVPFTGKTPISTKTNTNNTKHQQSFTKGTYSMSGDLASTNRMNVHNQLVTTNAMAPGVATNKQVTLGHPSNNVKNNSIFNPPTSLEEGESNFGGGIPSVIDKDHRVGSAVKVGSERSTVPGVFAAKPSKTTELSNNAAFIAWEAPTYKPSTPLEINRELVRRKRTGEDYHTPSSMQVEQPVDEQYDRSRRHVELIESERKSTVVMAEYKGESGVAYEAKTRVMKTGGTIVPITGPTGTQPDSVGSKSTTSYHGDAVERKYIEEGPPMDPNAGIMIVRNVNADIDMMKGLNPNYDTNIWDDDAAAPILKSILKASKTKRNAKYDPTLLKDEKKFNRRNIYKKPTSTKMSAAERADREHQVFVHDDAIKMAEMDVVGKKKLSVLSRFAGFLNKRKRPNDVPSIVITKQSSKKNKVRFHRDPFHNNPMILLPPANKK